MVMIGGNWDMIDGMFILNIKVSCCKTYTPQNHVVQFWVQFGYSFTKTVPTVLVQFWYSFGTVLVQFWYSFGTVLVQFCGCLCCIN